MTALYQRPTYHAWLRSEADLIGTDGCTGVTGYRVICCLEHDVTFYHGRDPRHAYLRWRNGKQDPWQGANPVTFRVANARFRRCHQVRSSLGMYSPVAWYRWLGVNLPRARRSWAKHRAERPAQS